MSLLIHLLGINPHVIVSFSKLHTPSSSCALLFPSRTTNIALLIMPLRLQILDWVPPRQRDEGNEHRCALEDVQTPFVLEEVAVDSHRELDEAEDGADLNDEC
jgi:hypothetical protein